MIQWIIMLLLPAAAWSGWWLAMRNDYRKIRLDKTRNAYFEGVGYLLNEQTEEAVNAFMSIPSDEYNHFEGKLRLGVLFRKRGDVDKALSMHQSLLQHVAESSKQHAELLLEIGEDYRSAGMYAQSLATFEQLWAMAHHQNVAQALIELYERTEQWEKVYELAKQWQDCGYGSKQIALSHYACELAIRAYGNQQEKNEQYWLERAQRYHPKSARVALLRGMYALAEQRYADAQVVLADAVRLDESMVVEVLPLMRQLFTEQGKDEDYTQYLMHLASEREHALVINVVIDELQQLQQEACAERVLAQAVSRLQSPLLLKYYTNDNEQCLPDTLLRALNPNMIFQCGDCGFKQAQRCWHCPSCFGWQTFRVIYAIHVTESV